MVTVLDYAGTAATNPILLHPNGNQIQGNSGTFALIINRQSVNLIYLNSTQGWISYADQGVALTPPPLAVEALVVAGGGGGAGSHGGGGGAGGLIYSATQVIALSTAYTITVGAGGAGGDTTPNSGTQGANSVFSTLTAIGGGGGAKPFPSATVGGNGGSGGGGGRGAAGGTATATQGNNGGGSSDSAPNYGGGGGGGAGAVGADGTTTVGGNGGVGLSYSITGSATYYAGGGGGGTYGGGTLGTGGLGGGGNGGAAGNGTANTGGGGGAGSDAPSNASGAGGSGVVIIAFPTSAGLYINPITGSLTYTSSTSSRAGFTVYTFTGGTGTITFTTTSPNVDPYFANVSLLTNSANELSFADASTNNFAITNTGGVKPSLFTPFAGGVGGSQYFNGSNRLHTTSTALFGSSDYTVEAWINYNTVPTGFTAIINGQSSGSLNFYYDGGTYATNQLIISNRSSNQISYTWIPTANTWYHLAVSRSGSSVKMFIDGAQVATATDSTNYSTSANYDIGYDSGVGSGMNGFISNVRTVNGTGLYTANFTPPTAPLTAVSGTSLLINGTNQNTFDNATFYDQSANSFAITKFGSPVYSGLSPFSNAYPGSVYCNGSSYLTVASNAAFALGTENYTVEGFAYFDGSSSDQNIIDMRGIDGTGNQIRIAKNATNLNLGYGALDIQISTTWPGLNNWFHFAAVRSGTSVAFFVNGTRVGTATDSTNLAQSAIQIGTYSATMALLTGYVSNIRIVKGTAVYDPASTTISVPTAPLPNTANTSLLLGCDTGAFYDLSNVGNPISQAGSPVVTTQVSPFSSVTESYYFNGSSYITANANTGFTFGTNNFTVETWFNASSYAVSGVIFSTTTAFNVSNNFYLQLDGLGSTFIVSSNGTTLITAINTFSLNTWYHIAVSRVGSSMTFFINGVSQGSVSNSQNFTSNTPVVGSINGTSFPVNGHINNLRITKGVARYTATFTPPTAPFPTSA